MSEYEIRQKAYQYILGKIASLPASPGNAGQPPSISLDELLLIKQGLADPSTELVVSLKQLLRGSIPETEIDEYLIAPFSKNR